MRRWFWVVLVALSLFGALFTGSDVARADEPNKVTVGVYINAVHQLDLESHNYLVDFYLWLRWTNPEIDPSSTIESMNVTESWDFKIVPIYDTPITLEDGSLYQVIHYQGRFYSDLPLQRFPFDRQKLILTFEDTALNTDGLVFVPDTNPASSQPDIALPGWNMKPPTLEVIPYLYPTNFGSTDLKTNETYSRVVITLPVERPRLTSAIKLFFPLSLVLLTAVLTFFLLPTLVEARISTAITSLLTLVALQFTVNENLPSVEYLMMIDVIYGLSFVYVLFTLGMSVHAAWKAERSEAAEVIAFDRHMLVYGLAGYLGLVGAVMLYYLL